MNVHLANTPVIETENLTLRAPGPQDWPIWHDFAITDRAQYIGGPYTTRSAWRGFGHAVGMWVLRGYGSFVITFKGDDTALGMVGPYYPADWPEKELGWTIWNPELEGKGIAYEAALASRRFAYDPLGWTGAVSYIDHGNDRSVRLAERLGAWLDEDAQQPDHSPCMIYRHPSPEALA